MRPLIAIAALAAVATPAYGMYYTGYPQGGTIAVEWSLFDQSGSVPVTPRELGFMEWEYTRLTHPIWIGRWEAAGGDHEILQNIWWPDGTTRPWHLVIDEIRLTASEDIGTWPTFLAPPEAIIALPLDGIVDTIYVRGHYDLVLAAGGIYRADFETTVAPDPGQTFANPTYVTDSITPQGNVYVEIGHERTNDTKIKASDFLLSDEVVEGRHVELWCDAVEYMDWYAGAIQITETPRGDCNFDGAVNGADVAPFVQRILSGPQTLTADINEDGAVNGLDVAPFVDAVIAGGAQAVPEPCTFGLAVIAFFGLLRWRGKRTHGQVFQDAV